MLIYIILFYRQGLLTAQATGTGVESRWNMQSLEHVLYEATPEAGGRYNLILLVKIMLFMELNGEKTESTSSPHDVITILKINMYNRTCVISKQVYSCV